MSKASDIAAKLEAIKAQKLQQSQHQRFFYDQAKVAEAESNRRFENVGDVGIKCNTPCHGPGVPEGMIDHRSGGQAVVAAYGVKIEGITKPYLAHRCNLCNTNKLCVATDPVLEAAVRRGKELG